MKMCPDCHATYDDDVEICASDGTELLDADTIHSAIESVPEVLHVAPDDATSLVDLEAMEDKLKARAVERQHEEESRRAEEAKLRERLDPDATGTLHLDQIGSAGGARTNATGKTTPYEQTQITRHRAIEGTNPSPGAPTAMKPAAKKKNKPKKGINPIIVVGLLGFFFVFVLVVAGALYYFLGPARGPAFTVTSVPPGAAVLLDGDNIGEAPLTTRKSVGTHTIELTLEGYQPFKEVINIPAEGLSFLQPLKAIKGFRPPPKNIDDTPEAEPNPAADDASGKTDAGPANDVDDASKTPMNGTDALASAAQAMIDAGDYDGALSNIKLLIKTAPDDKRGETLLDALANARVAGGRAAADANPKTRPKTGDKGGKGGRRTSKGGRRSDDSGGKLGQGKTQEEKKAFARTEYQEGERQYKNGRIDAAKLKFKNAIQLDSRFYFPHRSIARIFQREGNVKQARYHLKRYLRLGGPDPDFKVRNWLDQNGGK